MMQYTEIKRYLTIYLPFRGCLNHMITCELCQSRYDYFETSNSGCAGVICHDPVLRGSLEFLDAMHGRESCLGSLRWLLGVQC